MKTKIIILLAILFFFSGALSARAASGSTLGNNFITFGTGGSGDRQFNEPLVPFDDTVHHKLYITDMENNRVVKMDDGEVSGKALGDEFTSFDASESDIGQFNQPSGIFVDTTKDKVYIGDQYNNRVVMMDDGEVPGTAFGDDITSFGSFGPDSSQFNNVAGIYVDTANNKLYVADESNGRIDKMSAGEGGPHDHLGDGFTSFDAESSDIGQFGDPLDVIIDSANNKLYVADFGNYRICKMDDGEGGHALGDEPTSFGIFGSDTGQFNDPMGLSADFARDKIYITDIGNNRIVEMDDGEGTTTFGGEFTSFGTQGFGNGQFNSPSGPFVDATNNIIYVADAGNNRIVKMDSDNSTTDTNNSSSPDPVIHDWSSYKYEDNSSCQERLSLTVEGHKFDKDADVYIGQADASKIKRESSQKLIATFCLSRLINNKASHTKNIYVQNPNSDKVRADDQIDLDNVSFQSSSDNSNNNTNSNGANTSNHLSASDFDRNTQQGTINIQTVLNKLGYLDKENITGYFGPLTTDAIKKFQADNSLPATGFVGLLTMEKLAEKS